MAISDGAPPMRWMNERCTMFSPAVYGPDFRMRCNHAGCSVRVAEEDADLGLDIGDESPRGKITITSSSDEEEEGQAPPAPMLVDAEADASDLSGDDGDISLDESDEDFVDDSEQSSVDHAAVASATEEIEARAAEEEAQAAAERAHAKKLIDLEIAALQEQRKAFEDNVGDDAGAVKESTAGAGDVELADAAGKE